MKITGKHDIPAARKLMDLEQRDVFRFAGNGPNEEEGALCMKSDEGFINLETGVSWHGDYDDAPVATVYETELVLHGVRP